MWTLLQPDNAHPGGDRTAGDDDALASAANELRHIGGETAQIVLSSSALARGRVRMPEPNLRRMRLGFLDIRSVVLS